MSFLLLCCILSCAGAGGLLLDRDGNRFFNELGRRDQVTGAMWNHDKVRLSDRLEM